MDYILSLIGPLLSGSGPESKVIWAVVLAVVIGIFVVLTTVAKSLRGSSETSGGSGTGGGMKKNSRINGLIITIVVGIGAFYVGYIKGVGSVESEVHRIFMMPTKTDPLVTPTNAAKINRMLAAFNAWSWCSGGHSCDYIREYPELIPLMDEIVDSSLPPEAGQLTQGVPTVPEATKGSLPDFGGY